MIGYYLWCALVNVGRELLESVIANKSQNKQRAFHATRDVLIRIISYYRDNLKSDHHKKKINLEMFTEVGSDIKLLYKTLKYITPFSRALLPTAG